jgi:hypothetical protein
MRERDQLRATSEPHRHPRIGHGASEPPQKHARFAAIAVQSGAIVRVPGQRERGRKRALGALHVPHDQRADAQVEQARPLEIRVGQVGDPA